MTAQQTRKAKPMSKARFKIAFEGGSFDDGEMDVRDLAPTLLAFGDIVQAANRVLNGDRSNARLKVAATEKGSFIAALTTDVGWLSDMLDAVSAHSNRVVAANELMDLLIKFGEIGGGSIICFFTVIKHLRGKRPENVKPRGDGTTEITINNEIILTDDRTVDLLQDLPTRQAVEEFGKKAENITGLDALRIGRDTPDNEGVRLERENLPYLRVPSAPEKPDVETSHRDVWLKIVSVHFRDGYKWRFSDGGERAFTAKMEDIDFQNKVQEGKITLNANDTLRCHLREEQSLSASSLVKTIFVEKVEEYRTYQQLNLL